MYGDITGKMIDIYTKFGPEHNREVIQSVAFGLGVIAQRLPAEQYAEYAEQFKAILEEIIGVEDNMSDDN